MKSSKKAFTLIELIFVIVILGVLGSIAISKMAVTRDDAQIAKGRSQVSAIRNAIMLARQQMMLQGQVSWLNSLDDNTSGVLFGSDGTTKILDYPIYAKDENGKITNYIAIKENITRRKKAEKELNNISYQI